MSPHSENEMSEELWNLDVLLSDDSPPTLDDLLHPTKELNTTMVEYACVLLDENDRDPRKIAKLLPEMTPQQVQDLLQEHSACRDSNDVKGKGSLSPEEPQENGPIPAYRKRQYEVQVSDKNEEKKVHDSNNVKGKEILPEPEPEKEKTSKRKGIWSEEEKRLFLSALDKYRPGQWKDISRHIGTRDSEQVRTYARKAGYRRDLSSSRPEPGLHDIYGNFGGSVCHASWNLGGEMGANPSSRNSDQVWNSTNSLSSDSYGCLRGPPAYGNNMNPGQ